MADKKVEVNVGGGFLGLLTLLFIGLKLGNVINWSWWWVLAPIWIPFSLVGLLLIVAGLLYALAHTLGD